MAQPQDQQMLDLGVAVDRTRSKRADAIYGTHAYHTKVPPTVAAAYIEEHCPADGLVLDPFCGSGMTGVGASMVGRQARLSDLSPAAVHIARNYGTPCPVERFDAAVQRVLEAVGDDVRSLYVPAREGAGAQVEHVVWSDVRRCPQCPTDILLWEQRDAGLRRLTCPACGHQAAKAEFTYAGERPVETAVSTPDGRRHVRPAAEGDVPAQVAIPAEHWFPTDAFDASRPMWRRSHGDMAIATVADFFSRRNLAALAALWHAAGQERDERVRSALTFSLTAIVNRASRRYQWNAKRPTNVLGGTLYVSSLRYEWNVLSLWRRKVAAVRKLLATGPAREGLVEVVRESATQLAVADESIDYCFCDPPFGAHIVYSDASLLWEAWLGQLTERESEAIVVRGGDQPKSVDDYGELLRQAFAEIRRVLKPGAKATVVFQATATDVWAAIAEAGRAAGLSLVDATTLNKGQPSFKQIKGTVEGERVAHTDVVLTFAREPIDRRRASSAPMLDVLAAEVAAARAAGAPINVGHVYAVVAAARLREGLEPLTFDEVAALLDEHHATATADACA